MAIKLQSRFVFINCPLDKSYIRLRQAMTFAVMDCGFTPRIAIESSDGGKVRIVKILEIIADCEFGIHDLTRVQLDRLNRLPRFNMAFELGLFIGAKHFGGPRHQNKRSLIFERRKYELQKCLSDTAGQDLELHSNKIPTIINKVRDWLTTEAKFQTVSGGTMSARFVEFMKWMRKAGRDSKIEIDEMPFNEYCRYVQKWLMANEISSTLGDPRIQN